jgi:hypothetical protein
VSTPLAFRTFDTGADFTSGTHEGTAVVGGRLVIDSPAGTLFYDDPYAADRPAEEYEWATWSSPSIEPGFGIDSVIPSWNAATPDGSWVMVETRVSRDGRQWGGWLVLARWAETSRQIHRRTQPDQGDESVEVLADVAKARSSARWVAYQLRVSLLRPVGIRTRPTVRMLGAIASGGSPDPDAPVSTPGIAKGVELSVPAYSQQVLRGRYPQWDAGGQSWCSPTATTMVLHAWGLGPRREEYSWVASDVPNRYVVHAVADVFDYSYGGGGNWAFNTAYAGRYGAHAFVTRLRSLAEAELFIESEIPLVASVAFAEGELPGAGYSTEGHLLCIVGFDDNGDVICNDPASGGEPNLARVRVVYDRARFERVWQRLGGVVYVIHPPDVALPKPPVAGEPNW